MTTKASRAAAEEIKKYIYENGVITLGNFHLEKIAEIIEKHTDGTPDNGTKIPHYSKLKGILKRHKFCGISLATKIAPLVLTGRFFFTALNSGDGVYRP